MIHYKIVNQRSNNDCAVACLLMILKHYNIKANYNEIKAKLNTKEDGTRIYDIVKVSKKYGINAVGYKKIKIDKIKEPVIALVINDNISHFVVIYKVKKNFIIIADPAAKVMKISKEYFEKYFTGIIIKFIKKTPKKKNLLIIVFYFFINILIIILNFLLLFIVYRYIYFLELNNYFLNYKYAIIFLLFYVFKSILIYIKDILTIKIKISIDKKITLPFIDKLLSSKIIIKKSIVNDLIGKYHDLNYIKDLYFKFISVYIINFLFLLVSLIFLFVIDYKITLLLLVYVSINIFFNYKYYSMNYFKILDNQISREKYFSKITNVFNNIKKTNNFRKENYNTNKIKKEYNSYTMKYKKIENSNILKNLICDLFYLFFLIVIIMYINILNVKFSNAFYVYSLITIIIDVVDSFSSDFPSIMNYKAIKERLKI